jgi:hypothetical protein
VAATSDDDQPTAAVDGGDKAGHVADSPQTVAAEQHSEAPTTIVPDVGPTVAPELAWSEAETEEIAHRRDGRLLWIPLMALLSAAAAVVVWFSVTLYRQHERPGTAAPSSTSVAAPPPARTAPSPPAPIPPPPPPSPPPTSTTQPPPAATGPRIGEECSDWSKISRDPNTGLTIICDGATGAGTTPHWTTDDFSHVIGVQTIGTSCANSQPYAMAISPDDYLVACFPADAGGGQLAGPGATWQIYHP